MVMMMMWMTTIVIKIMITEAKTAVTASAATT